MRLDLSRLRTGVERLERRYDPSAFDQIGADFRLAGPVDLAIDVRREGRRVRLTGKLVATLECDCSRCLEPFAIAIDAPIDLLFLPEGEQRDPAEREVTVDDFGVSFYRDDEIDLSDVMREQFYLALPMKPLCQPDCQGLCPVCGVNRNRETCTCQTGWVDPRLAGLKRLLREQ